MKYKAVLVTLFLLFAFGTQTLAENMYDSQFIEGSRCPKPANGNENSVCGIIRSHDPEEAFEEDEAMSAASGNMQMSHKGVPNVSVFIYECDPSSPTCKLDGNIIHPYCSTYSNEDGYFYCPMRVVGGQQIRYLVTACEREDGTYALDDIIRLDSTQSYPYLSIYSRCPNDIAVRDPATPPPAPSIFRIMDLKGNVHINCDMGNQGTGKVPSTVEISEAKKNQTVIETTFVGGVKRADQRFTPNNYEDIFAKVPSVIAGAANSGSVHQGSFWSKDCKTLTYDRRSQDIWWKNMCDTGDPDKYELDTYTRGIEGENKAKPYVIESFYPALPAKAVMLFPREMTFRLELVGYAQNPNATYAFNQTHFGMCLQENEGLGIKIRKFLDPDTFPRISCETYKKCTDPFGINYGVNPEDLPDPTKDTEEYRSEMTTTGPGVSLSSYNTFEDIWDKYYVETGYDPVICVKPDTDEEVKISQIKKPWDPDCGGGECSLGSDYWSPEMLMYYSAKAGTALSSSTYGIVGSSYQANPADPSKSDPLGALMESQDPLKSGNAIVFGGYKNDPASNPEEGKGSVTFGAQISSNIKDISDAEGLTVSQESYPIDPKFTDTTTMGFGVKDDPAFTDLLYREDYPLVKFGGEIQTYCMLSNANNLKDKINSIIISKDNELEFYRSNEYIDDETGVVQLDEHHYLQNPQANTPAPPTDPASMGTSDIRYTTAAINRSEKLLELDGDLLEKAKSAGTHLYDAVMNASAGSGEIKVSGFTVIEQFLLLLQGKTAKYKNFFDRGGTIAELRPEPMDNFIVNYNHIETEDGGSVYEAVTEESFAKFFPLPANDSTFKTQIKDDRVVSPWGENYCYPWGNGLGDNSNKPRGEDHSSKVAEKFGTVIPMNEYCGDEDAGSDEDDKKLPFTEDINIGREVTINGEKMGPNVPISRTCRPVDCKKPGDGVNESSCNKFEWVYCAWKQKTTLIDKAPEGKSCDKECDHTCCPVNGEGNENVSVCCESGCGSGDPGNICASTCKGDTPSPQNCLAGTNECCATGECEDKNGNSEPGKQYQCPNAWYVSDEVYCTVQVAGPFGAQGKFKECDGSAEMMATMDIVPQRQNAENEQASDATETEEEPDDYPYTESMLGAEYLALKNPRSIGEVGEYCPVSDDPSYCMPIDVTMVAGGFNIPAMSTAEDVAGTEQRTTPIGVEKDKAPGSGVKYQEMQEYATDGRYAPDIEYPTPNVCSTNTLDYGWDCSLKDVPNPAEADLDKLVPGCGLSALNTAACKTALGVDPATYTFSPTFVKVLQGAANAFQVPASLLLAQMKITGGLNDFADYWKQGDISKPESRISLASNISREEQNLIWSLSSIQVGTTPWWSSLDKYVKTRNGKTYYCNDLNYNEQGPFYLTGPAFENIKTRNDPGNTFGTAYDALNTVSMGRGETAHRCNFLDSA